MLAKPYPTPIGELYIARKRKARASPNPYSLLFFFGDFLFLFSGRTENWGRN